MPTPYTPRAFLLIERPRERLDAWINALAALDAPRAPKIAAVVAHYDESADIALLDLQYDALVFDEQARQYIVEVALAAKIGMIQPDKLTDDECRRFLAARLARCGVHLAPQSSFLGAVAQLMREVTSRRAHVNLPPLPPVALRGRAKPPPIPPAVTAKGTRDNLEPVVLDADDDERSPTSPHPAPRLDRYVTNKLPPRAPARGSRPPARSEEDYITSPLDLVAFQAMAADKRHPDRIHVRYLRGGRWLAARVGGISLNGATLLSGAVPRLNDHVDIALSFGEHRAIVRGIVAKLSTTGETASTGAAVFTLRFLLDEHSRPELTALLVAARDARVTITPPPARASRRFPVEWLVALGLTKGLVRVTALDVSVGGMFVQSNVPLLLDATATVSLVLDDGYPPISARAKVVRRISDAEAKTCGLVAGFGLAISGMSELHHTRWLGFLARIERRAQKRVLLGAHPARFADLQAALANLGYAVIGGTDPAMLVHLANNTRPADAVLLDAGWLQDEASATIVEELLASRQVPCVRMQGEVLRAREAIDRLLDVV